MSDITTCIKNNIFKIRDELIHKRKQQCVKANGYNSTFNSKEEAIEYLNTHAKNNTMEFGKSKNTKFGGDVEMTGENSAGSSSDMDDLFHRMKEMGINDPEPQNWNALFKIVDE